MIEPPASDATLKALEVPSVLALLGGLAATDLGRQRLLALSPILEAATLDQERGRFLEMQRLMLDGAAVQSSEDSLQALLDRLDTGRPPVTGGDLVRLAALLRATHEASERIASADPPLPLLASRAGGVPPLRHLEARIERTLDRRGEVREDATPTLVALRKAIRGVRDRLYKQLQSSLGEMRDLLSEDTIPLRNNRLVLMLQSGARGQARGLVHGRSATGKSYYFEPLDAVEPNNQLQQAMEDEEAERRRILAELLEAVREELEAIGQHGDFLGTLDLLQAKCRFAEKSGGRLAEIANPGELRLIGARHPLLDPRLAALRTQVLGQAGHTGDVVALDVELGGDSRVLVVTGPNAGGKTVALKTVGLLALAHQCALPLPVDAGTRLPRLAHVVATVGDEQDMLTDRSTFSGRLLRLREAWDVASPRTLVLLDELGSGTDPEEGAALSTALLEGLLATQCLGVITTHLTRVAAAALDLGGAACAAMEFAPATGRPTFHLVKGPPGGSEALALARRLGLPGAWLDRAEALLGPEHRDLRGLLAEVERAREEMTEARLQLETETGDLAKVRGRLERERAALEAERSTTASRLKAELERFRRETQQRLRGEVERMQAALGDGRRRNLAGEATARLFADAPRVEVEAEATDGPLVVGAEVRHRSMGWRGVLEKLEGGRAEIRVQGKRLVVAEGELLTASAPEAKVRTKARAEPSRGANDLAEAASAPSEINLIGARVEAALEALEAYLDRAVLAEHREVRVIHGHGSGRLREAVRQHLRRHRGVIDLRPGAENEGGNGATVVTLRGD
ncbi:MAG: Smr/MutS family protein [Acidobacteriota bacterium]